jgi:hypothetical protein
LGGGWWIRIDSPYDPGNGTFVQDCHFGDKSGDLGSFRSDGQWKHFKGNEVPNRVRKSNHLLGWVIPCSLIAYFQQNPLDFLAILLDIQGEHQAAARVDRLNEELGYPSL